MLGELIAGVGLIGSGAAAVFSGVIRLENRITSGFARIEAQMIASNAETKLLEQRILRRLEVVETRLTQLEKHSHGED